MAHLESRLCIALNDRWMRTYPEYKNCLLHVPNGAHLAGNAGQRARLMARLKAEGLRPGASDYFIAVPRGVYHGMWLEVKAGRNKPAKNQLEWLDTMTNNGNIAKWGAGMDECWSMIEKYMEQNDD